MVVAATSLLSRLLDEAARPEGVPWVVTGDRSK
jgi:hypothetical protein